jgi:hypothetical protein
MRGLPDLMLLLLLWLASQIFSRMGIKSVAAGMAVARERKS